MNRSAFLTIKYMNRSVFPKARYMNGVGSEILAHTPVPKLPPSYRYPVTRALHLPRPPLPLNDINTNFENLFLISLNIFFFFTDFTFLTLTFFFWQGYERF